jgi:hypothetical protein
MIHFCTFADSSNSLTLQRIRNEALSVFEHVHTYNENDLSIDFLKEHNNFIQKNKRGYGYWIWKPQVIIQTLEKMKEGDILVYSDAGCSINKQNMHKLKEYVKVVNIHELVGFNNGANESSWCKMDLLILLNRKPETQVVATSFIAKKSTETVEFFKKWLHICSVENYRYLDDSKSIEPNSPDFKEHRHDQSIFSLLFKNFKGYELDYQLKSTDFLFASRVINKKK